MKTSSISVTYLHLGDAFLLSSSFIYEKLDKCDLAAFFHHHDDNYQREVNVFFYFIFIYYHLSYVFLLPSCQSLSMVNLANVIFRVNLIRSKKIKVFPQYIKDKLSRQDVNIPLRVYISI